MWPEGKDMAWLNKNIEAYALSIASEVELSKNGFHVQLALDLARAVMVLPSLSQVQAFMDRDYPCN